MKTAFVFSLFIKGLGAFFEIASQIVITRFGGVEIFGEYNFYISIVDIVCWLFFSGIVKTNAFYVANGKNIKSFRRSFFLLYALPLVIVLSAIGLLFSSLLLIVMAASFLYGLQMNLSSIFLAVGRYKASLFGEYLVSRLVIFTGAIALALLGAFSPEILTGLYAVGFLASVAYFTVRRKDFPVCAVGLSRKESRELVSKQVRFQLTDVATGLINQAPVIVQYLFAGAFQAGALSVVLVARKIINFVAGPAAKVYLPEFARCYSSGDMACLRRVYREIVLLQLCFVVPIAFVLLCAPDTVLILYNSGLASFAPWLRFAAFFFVLMVLFGPQGNLLSMAGQERVEMWGKWASLAGAVAVMAATHDNDMFVLYGIAAQVVIDSSIKCFFVIRVLGGFPLGMSDWIRLSVPAAVLAIMMARVPGGCGMRFALSCIFACILMLVLTMLFFWKNIVRKVRRV